MVGRRLRIREVDQVRLLSVLFRTETDNWSRHTKRPISALLELIILSQVKCHPSRRTSLEGYVSFGFRNRSPLITSLSSCFGTIPPTAWHFPSLQITPGFLSTAGGLINRTDLCCRSTLKFPCISRTSLFLPTPPSGPQLLL